MLFCDKIDFKSTMIKRDKEGNYTMVKGSMQQEELTILNICAPNIEALRYIKQVLNELQRLRLWHNNSGKLNSPPSILDRSMRQN